MFPKTSAIESAIFFWNKEGVYFVLKYFFSWFIRKSVYYTNNWSFPLRISLVNVTKFAGNCGFGHIYRRNS